MKNIHESLDPITGVSELFDNENLLELNISRHEDLFLLFLPTYYMYTPLQCMLTRRYFDLFNKIVPLIEQYFEEFITDEKLLQKIMEMFIYSFDNSYSYPQIVIQVYCSLLFDSNDLYDDDESEEILKELQMNIRKAKKYLIRIVESIQKQKKFLNSYQISQ